MSDSEDQYVRANRESVEAFESDNARTARLTDAEIEGIISMIEGIPAAAKVYASGFDGQVVRALRQQQAEIAKLRAVSLLAIQQSNGCGFATCIDLDGDNCMCGEEYRDALAKAAS